MEGKELPPSRESERVSKDQVIAAYRKFVEAGMKSPDRLDHNDPEVQAAHEVFYKWQAELDAEAGDDENARQRANFEKTRIYVEAGFTDWTYLQDVLHFLNVDAADIEKDPDDPAKTQLRKDVADEMKKIRSMMKEGADS